MAGTIYTKEEIADLREGGKRLADVVRQVAEACAPGVSTAELNEIAEKLIRDCGDTPSFLGYTPRGAKRAFPAAICISVNEEVVHGIPNEDARTIHDGDIVGLDCGITHKGLITDHCISMIAGSGDDAAKKLLKANKDALMAGIKAARGGAHVGDVGAVVEAIGRENGYGIVFELGGHGVGHRVHEEPYIANVGIAGEGEEFIPGMVVAIEPMFTEGSDRVKLMPDGYTYVTKDGSRAAHFEHTILITEGEPEILTAL
jgi:methionyl aminopeptidase